MFNKHEIARDACQLFGKQAVKGYDWWWHNFTARHEETGKEKAFFIDYFVCNPGLKDEIPVLGQLEENKKKGKKPSYLMVKAGCWGEGKRQLHRFFAWDDIKVSMGVPYRVQAPLKDDGLLSCTASENRITGEIRISEEEAKEHPEWMCDAGWIKWDLKVEKKVAFNVGYGASGPMRKWQLFEMFWHAEGMKSFYSGEIFLNGERYIVEEETSFGYADKNWGRDFTSPWVWLSSCSLTSEITGRKLKDSVFDIGGGCPKVGPIALKRKLLSAFWYEGRGFEFNFSKFWTFCLTKFEGKETEDKILWHVEQKTLRNKMVADFSCRKEDMLLINYEAPDGRKRHNRLWNGGTGEGTVSLYRDGKLVDRVHADHMGCEYGEFTE